MTTSTAAFLEQSYGLSKALGDKSVSSDAMFVIKGFEHLRLLCKQFPWPIMAPAGEIEVPSPMGSKSWQPQQLETAKQGQVSFFETVRGDMETFIEQITLQGCRFNASVYEGTMERYSRGVEIRDCFLQLESPDRDWENRSQVTTISGTLFYHYFGKKIPGNIEG
jgi:hypothetical protein